MKSPVKAPMKMKISLSKLPIVPLLGFGTLLAGCAGKADLVACPQITAPLDTVSAYQLSDEAAALVDIRFNGVSAVCDMQDNGNIRMNVAIGMKLKRLEKSDLDDGVSINIATAVVGADDNVVSNDRIVFQAGFQAGSSLKYPVVDYRVTVAPDQRLVLSLLPAP